MKEEIIDYKKKQKIYEKLGAKEFKKIVLQLEKVKWNIIKKIMPNYISLYEKICKKEYRKKIKKAKTPEEQKEIKDYYRRKILLARKEFNNDQNRNYHIDTKRPTEILNYIQWNKKVHQQSLINNFALATICVGCMIGNFYPGIANAILILQIPAAVINWQCVNLQNYNICRIKSHSKLLSKIESRQEERATNNYLCAAKVIEQAYCDSKEEIVPTVHEIIDKIQTREQLEQMKQMVEQQLTMYRCSDIDKTKSEGAKK